jgi:hypothetical protein
VHVFPHYLFVSLCIGIPDLIINSVDMDLTNRFKNPLIFVTAAEVFPSVNIVVFLCLMI